jgi:peptidoglycan/xylan/chitin deacetylase (PgdA/CDA1 family)
MNARTETLIDSALRRSPAQPVFRWRAARQLAVLAYHGIDDPQRFVEHLDHIRTTSRVVSLAEVVDAFEGRRALPRHALLITFDDGHRSVLEFGLPLLRERGMPAVVFVVAGLVDSDRPFWWTEVAELEAKGGFVEGMREYPGRELVLALKRVDDDRRRAAIEQLRATARVAAGPMRQLSGDDLRTLQSAGVDVGNHTWSHPCLARCKPEIRRREIDRSHHLLTSILGRSPVAFAYPDGGYDPVVEKHLRQLGYRTAFLFDHRLSKPRPRNPFAVSRLRVNSWATPDRFRTIATGLHPAIHRLRGRA